MRIFLKAQPSSTRSRRPIEWLPSDAFTSSEASTTRGRLAPDGIGGESDTEFHFTDMEK